MATTEATRFVERFSEVWRSPEPDAFAAFWHSDGKLFHPTMEEPIPSSEIPAYIGRVQEVLPDIRLRVRHWAAQGDVVFVEWTASATALSSPVSWDGVDRFTLHGERATEGVAYFDSAPLSAQLGQTAAPSDISRVSGR